MALVVRETTVTRKVGTGPERSICTFPCWPCGFSCGGGYGCCAHAAAPKNKTNAENTNTHFTISRLMPRPCRAAKAFLPARLALDYSSAQVRVDTTEDCRSIR